MVRCAPWAVPHAREGELVQAHPGDCSPPGGPVFVMFGYLLSRGREGEINLMYRCPRGPCLCLLGTGTRGACESVRWFWKPQQLTLFYIEVQVTCSSAFLCSRSRVCVSLGTWVWLCVLSQ